MALLLLLLPHSVPSSHFTCPSCVTIFITIILTGKHDHLKQAIGHSSCNGTHGRSPRDLNGLKPGEQEGDINGVALDDLFYVVGQ